jgi:pimeloyl-ACP methyl ester carboxylesterase
MVLLLAGALVAAAVPTGTATAGSSTTGNDQVHYCKQVDAYRIETCATALLPASPLGRQLRWVLAQLAGEAATLTEAEVRAHFSAEFFAVRGEEWSPAALVAAFQQTIAERGTFTLVGFSYPPRSRQALALVQSTTGERGAIEIGVTTGRPARIEYFSLQEAPPTIVPKGRSSGWFDIGGRRLFLRCTGHRSPTVLFEGGLTTDWYDLQNQLTPFTRVCSYDHPNGPWSRSDPAPTPRTAHDFVADLHTLLHVAHVPGPYLLAGHSNGGLFTLLYASTYPRQVAGLVLIDAVHPATIKRRLAMLKPILSPEEWQPARLRMITLLPRLLDPEQVDIWTSERQTRTALHRSPIRPMPLVTLAHGHPDDPPPPYVELEEPFWRQLQRELAQLVPGGRLVVATESGHDIQHEQPELVLDAIRDVVLAVRAGDLVPTDERFGGPSRSDQPGHVALTQEASHGQTDLGHHRRCCPRGARVGGSRLPGCRQHGPHDRGHDHHPGDR